ncbi:hypothetical protein GCM10022198_08830 [Klugiella xanthotipulae]|uniref:Transposase n=1 Tax=Klugiella xanthotipulae TaxID=244735 RepID=A0A543HSZ1_9MICO|nr:hypothetical protein FB466_2336 [Klugiella xanthotipulae]
MIEAEKANKTVMTLTRMCQLLGVDRCRFYEWRARQAAGPSPWAQRAAELRVRSKGSMSYLMALTGHRRSAPICKKPV